MPDLPLVSIMIPTYNRSQLLPKAIRSAFTQSYPNLEIIISDNASLDDTEAVARAFATVDGRIQYSRNSENIGPIRNWRKCLDLAVGKFCLILSDDDMIIDVDYVLDGVALLQKNRSGLLVSASILDYGTRSISNLDLPELVDGEEFFLSFWHGDYQIPSISCIFSRELALQCNPFNNSNIMYSDIELWLKMMLFTPIIYRSFPSIYYRIHGTNIITTMSLSSHSQNIQFIDGVCRFAMTRAMPSNTIENWRSRMLRHYIYNIVLGECLQSHTKTSVFVSFAIEAGQAAGITRSEAIRIYLRRRFLRWLAVHGSNLIHKLS